jgi:hypothetical protein
MRTRTGEESVSVIVGTLLLILITVTAAAGLALMVSQMQKDEMNRQSHLNAVKNENITILNVAFENNQSEWYGVQNSRNWSSVKLTLVNMNTDDVRVVGIAINDRYALNFTDKSRTDSSVSSRNVLSGNLIIPAAKSKDIYIDFVANASDDPSGLIDYSQPQYFDVGNPQNIKVGTSLTNFFETTLKPPNPVYKMSTDSEIFGSGQRDVLVLDGSGSTADNPIVSWTWTIYDRSWGLDLASWTQADEEDLTNWAVHNQTISGKISRTYLNSTDPSGSILSPSGIPYYGSLTVTDSTGMKSTIPSYFAIPRDNQFSPPAILNILTPFQTGPLPNPPYTNGQLTNLTAKLTDINYNPVSGAIVTLNIDNNPNNKDGANCFFIPAMSNTTISDGTVTLFVWQSNSTRVPPPTTDPICPQPVIVHVQSGKLLSPTILIPGIP